MAFKSSQTLILPTADRLGSMTVKEKAILFRQRLIELGVDLECPLDKHGQRLPPASDYEILFTGSPFLTEAWDNFLLRVIPKGEAELARKNLLLNQLMKGKVLKDKEEEQMKIKKEEQKQRIAALMEEKRKKEEKLKHLEEESKKLSTKSAQKKRESMKRRKEKSAKEVMTQSFRKSQSLTESQKLKPIFTGLKDIDKVLAKAVEDEVDSTGDSGTKTLSMDKAKNSLQTSSEVEGLGTKLSTLVAFLKRELVQSIEEVINSAPSPSSSSSIASAKSNDSNNNTTNGTSSVSSLVGSVSYWHQLSKIFSTHSRLSILNALEAETEFAIRGLDADAAEAEASFVTEARDLNCSLDESGTVVDQAVDSEKLQKRKELAKNKLQFKLLTDNREIEREHGQCGNIEQKIEAIKIAIKESLISNGTENGKVESIMVALEAYCQKKAIKSLHEFVQEEIQALERDIADNAGQEVLVASKQAALEASKAEMKSVDNSIDALTIRVKKMTCTIQEKIKDGTVEFKEEKTKDECQALSSKAASLTQHSQICLEDFKKISLDHLWSTKSTLVKPGQFETKFGPEGLTKSTRDLVRAIDVLSSNSSEPNFCVSKGDKARCQHLDGYLSIPLARQSFDQVFACLESRREILEEAEAINDKKTDIKSLESAHEALEYWESQEEKDQESIAKFLEQGKENANVTNEHCVIMSNTERNLNEPGFMTLPDNLVEGKNVKEWMEVFNAIVLQQEMTKMQRPGAGPKSAPAPARPNVGSGSGSDSDP